MSGESAARQHVMPDVKLGRNVRIHAFANLHGCEIGGETKIGLFVKRGVSIGSGPTLLGGITIGENALVGAGSVTTRDVLPNTVTGNLAQPRDTQHRK